MVTQVICCDDRMVPNGRNDRGNQTFFCRSCKSVVEVRVTAIQLSVIPLEEWSEVNDDNLTAHMPS